MKLHKSTKKILKKINNLVKNNNSSLRLNFISTINIINKYTKFQEKNNCKYFHEAAHFVLAKNINLPTIAIRNTQNVPFLSCLEYLSYAERCYSNTKESNLDNLIMYLMAGYVIERYIFKFNKFARISALSDFNQINLVLNKLTGFSYFLTFRKLLFLIRKCQKILLNDVQFLLLIKDKLTTLSNFEEFSVNANFELYKKEICPNKNLNK